MIKLILSALLLFPFSFTQANSISITFVTPTAGQLVDSLVQVSVEVTSTFEVSTVVANVNGNQTTLVYQGTPGVFSGEVSIAGSAQGLSIPLSVTVTDIFGTLQTATLNILYVKKPVILSNAPIEWSNSYPSLPLNAICISADTCILTVKIEFQYLSQVVFLQSFTNAVDTTITVQPAVPGYAMVSFTATDKWDQQSTLIKWVFFDNNHFLSDIYNGPYRIFDFNYNKVLEVKDGSYPDPYPNLGTLVDIQSNVSTTIPFSHIDNFYMSFVSPYGAIYLENLNNRIKEWDNNSLITVGFNNPIPSFRTNGRYAVWGNSPAPNQIDIYRRDLANHSDQQVGTIQDGFTTDVAADGTVVYLDQDHQVYLYKNNTTTQITNQPGFSSIHPVTDGTNVLYMKKSDLNEYFIYMHNGTAESELSSLGTSLTLQDPYVHYQVRNKFVAYHKLGTSGQLQIWLRDSTGIQTQATFFNTNSMIEVLNDKGDIMFSNDGKRYIVKKGTIVPKDLGPAMGKVLYRDSSWYVIQGRHLYRLLASASVSVNNGNWNDPATWDNGIIPASNADVIILTNVNVTTNTTCNSLNVHLPGSITVAPGVNLTVLH